MRRWVRASLRDHCQVEQRGERLLELAINRLGLSARAYTRILKVARTIADLDEAAASRRIISAKRSSTARSTASLPDQNPAGGSIARAARPQSFAMPVLVDVEPSHELIEAIRPLLFHHEGAGSNRAAGQERWLSTRLGVAQRVGRDGYVRVHVTRIVQRTE